MINCIYIAKYLLFKKQNTITPTRAPSNKMTPQLIPMTSSGLEKLWASKSICSQRTPLNIWLHLQREEIMFIKEDVLFSNLEWIWIVAGLTGRRECPSQIGMCMLHWNSILRVQNHRAFAWPKLAVPLYFLQK